MVKEQTVFQTILNAPRHVGCLISFIQTDDGNIIANSSDVESAFEIREDRAQTIILFDVVTVVEQPVGWGSCYIWVLEVVLG